MTAVFLCVKIYNQILCRLFDQGFFRNEGPFFDSELLFRNEKNKQKAYPQASKICKQTESYLKYKKKEDR